MATGIAWSLGNRVPFRNKRNVDALGLPGNEDEHDEDDRSNASADEPFLVEPDAHGGASYQET